MKTWTKVHNHWGEGNSPNEGDVSNMGHEFEDGIHVEHAFRFGHPRGRCHVTPRRGESRIDLRGGFEDFEERIV